MRDLERLLVQRLLVRVVADAHESVENEVHLEDFLLLVIDDVLLLFLAKVARLESEGHIVEELAVLVGLRVEEEAEVVEHIVEEVMDDDTSFDGTRQSIDKIIIFLDL